ncbi:MAG TPA: multidrug efflux SMR transporter [Terriglobales bacterium]|nr:multidrug efflux SMR transporter [Terriglobales bacterium]
MAWVFLCLAIILDVTGTVFLKISDGLSRLVPTVMMLLCYGVSFIPLALAARELPVSLAYAVWSALGTALVFAIGMLWFHEPANTMKVSGIALIIVGIVVLNLASRV